MAEEIRYRERRSGSMETEIVPNARALRFIYQFPPARFIATRRCISRLQGWIYRRSFSRRWVRKYAEDFGVDLDEAERPLEEYVSLDDFFTRRLRAGSRPIDPEPDVLISPADGRVLVYPHLDGDAMQVKSSRVSLPELIGDPRLASSFREGTAVVIRLAPVDYHRFHFPCDGVASEARDIRGGYDSVHPFALDAGADGLRNHRMVTRLSSGRFAELLLIEVGAMGVGSMVQTFTPGKVSRGQEKGYFRFGGSTFILLIRPGRVTLDDDLLQSSADGVETLVKMGTRLALCPRAARGTLPS